MFNTVPLIFLLLQKLLFSPLEKIKNTTHDIIQGNLNKKIVYNAKNEIGDITLAVNNLSEKLKDATDFVKEIGKGNLQTEFKNLELQASNKQGLTKELLSLAENL